LAGHAHAFEVLGGFKRNSHLGSPDGGAPPADQAGIAGNLPPRRRTGYNLTVLQTVIDPIDARSLQGETGL